MTEEFQQKKKRNVHRSPAYPAVGLEKAISLIHKLDEKFSDDPFSRDTAANELGLERGGNSFRKIAALVHFGLIERKGSSYKMADLAKRIIFPGDDEEGAKTALIEAVKNPKLYKTLIGHYVGKPLPTALHHRLITQEKFNRAVAEKVVKDFKKSLDFAGILKNGIITNSEDTTISPEVKSYETPPSSEANDQPKLGVEKPKTTSYEGVSYSLGKDIIVVVSENMVREITRGKYGDKFAKALEDLEGLVREQSGEDSVPGS